MARHAFPSSFRYLVAHGLIALVAGLACLALCYDAGASAQVCALAGSVLLLPNLLFFAWWTHRVLRAAQVARQLSTALEDIAESGGVDRRIDIAGNEEETEFVRRINNLLDAMESAQRVHQATYEQLQQGIQVRSSEVTRANQALTEQNHTATSLAALSDYMRGNLSIETFSENVLTFLVDQLGALSGAFYVVDAQGERLVCRAAHALVSERSAARSFAFGEGLVGQTAMERFPKVMNGLPAKALRLRSALVESDRVNVLMMPIHHEGTVNAVVELASLHPFGDGATAFMDRAGPQIGISLHSHLTREELHNLLENYQRQAAALQEQQARLQAANEELAARNLELENAQRTIEEKAEQLSTTSRYKSEFMANMSHELRTPLNSLLILSQSMLENRHGNLNAEQLDFLATIHNAGQDLLNLIDDVLDLSRVEAGRLQVDFAMLNPADLIAPLDQIFRAEAERKGLVYELQLGAGTPRQIHTDGFRLQQILRNLIANAIKFTEAGSVRVRVGAEADGVLFEVTDTGIGIPEKQGAQIFEVFQQADSSTARRFGGTGLGLAICRQLTDLLHGRIDFESEEGAGSTFRLWLPRSAAEQPPVPAVAGGQHVDAAPDLAGRRVLIVDDDMRCGYALSQCLERAGLVTDLARNGREALDVLESHHAQHPVDLVVLDLMMPVMDGYDTLRHLRADPETRDLPVIAVTGDPDTFPSVMQAGFDTVLAKPVELTQLMRAIRVCFDLPPPETAHLSVAS